MQSTGETKIVNGQTYEIIKYKGQPFMLLHEQGIYVPVN